MFQTKVTEMLNIQYPIMQGGMQILSTAELVAAVSNAGGLGTLVSAMFPTIEGLRQEIRKTKSLTDRPFAVNFTLAPMIRPVNIEEYIDATIEEGVRIVETAARSPELYMKRFKDGGVTVIHKVARTRDAITAARVGADIVSVVGYEAGGMPGLEDITTMVRLPATVNAVKIPVLAAGGIADARGFLAALALGAEGIVMGTRFVVTKECPAHPKAKEWFLNARETDTMMIVSHTLKDGHRYLRNKPAEEFLELETKAATIEEIIPVLAGAKGRIVWEAGDIDAGVASCGQAVGLIHDISTVAEVINGIINGAKAILEERLYPLVKG